MSCPPPPPTSSPPRAATTRPASRAASPAATIGPAKVGISGGFSHGDYTGRGAGMNVSRSHREARDPHARLQLRPATPWATHAIGRSSRANCMRHTIDAVCGVYDGTTVGVVGGTVHATSATLNHRHVRCHPRGGGSLARAPPAASSRRTTSISCRSSGVPTMAPTLSPSSSRGAHRLRDRHVARGRGPTWTTGDRPPRPTSSSRRHRALPGSALTSGSTPGPVDFWRRVRATKTPLAHGQSPSTAPATRRTDRSSR